MTVQEDYLPLMTSGGKYVEPLEVMRRLRGHAANAPDQLRRTLEEGVLSPEDMGRVGAGLLEDLGHNPGAQNVAGDALSPARILTRRRRTRYTPSLGTFCTTNRPGDHDRSPHPVPWV